MANISNLTTEEKDTMLTALLDMSSSIISGYLSIPEDFRSEYCNRVVKTMVEGYFEAQSKHATIN